MRKIAKILQVKQWNDGCGKKHTKTFVLLEDGETASGYGSDYSKNDLVQVFMHDKYNQIKIRKPKVKDKPEDNH